MNTYKPMLLPNNKAGVAPDWEKRIANPIEWLYSNKLDGARIELFCDGTVKGRSLKPIPSIHIQQMGKDIIDSIPSFMEGSIVECEFFSPEMTFPEIMHFFFRCQVPQDKRVLLLNAQFLCVPLRLFEVSLMNYHSIHQQRPY